MKASVQTPFAPITIQITLESPQEVFLYQVLVGATLTVPNALYRTDPLREKQLREFMNELCDSTAKAL